MKDMGFNTTRPSVINLVDESSFYDMSNELRSTYRFYTLNGKNIFNADTFLKEFSVQILTSGTATNLSNFKDLFLDVLISGSELHTAFIWTNVDNMLDGGLGALITFSDILSSITRKLYKNGHTHINFFLGSGSNFPLPIK